MHDVALGPWAKSFPSSSWGMTAREFLSTEPRLSSFATPLLTIDREAAAGNVAVMADWLVERGLEIAPHGKTTMAPQLWQQLLDGGAWGITLATGWQVQLARSFGVRRIILANELIDPVALRWLGVELADPSFEFACWVDSVDSVELMRAGLAGAARAVDVVVELLAVRLVDHGDRSRVGGDRLPRREGQGFDEECLGDLAGGLGLRVVARRLLREQGVEAELAHGLAHGRWPRGGPVERGRAGLGVVVILGERGRGARLRRQDGRSAELAGLDERRRAVGDILDGELGLGLDDGLGLRCRLEDGDDHLIVRHGKARGGRGRHGLDEGGRRGWRDCSGRRRDDGTGRRRPVERGTRLGCGRGRLRECLSLRARRRYLGLDRGGGGLVPRGGRP